MSNNVKQLEEIQAKVNHSNLEVKNNPKQVFLISPLITLALVILYIALTVPLPFLAKVTSAPLSPKLFWVLIPSGLLVVWGALSEQVIVDQEKIQVSYPRWVSFFFRKGWSLSWGEIKDLKMRTTGQGGLVYYFTTHTGERAYLLPMRLAGFARLVKFVGEKTGIETTDIRPLSQPWMYLILFVLTLFLLLIDSWVIWTSYHL